MGNNIEKFYLLFDEIIDSSQFLSNLLSAQQTEAATQLANTWRVRQTQGILIPCNTPPSCFFGIDVQQLCRSQTLANHQYVSPVARCRSEAELDLADIFDG